MSAYNKFNQTVEDLAHKVHDLANDQLAVALTNTAPTAGNSVLADLTEIDYTNLSSRDITTVSSGQTAGTYEISLENLTLTASGGEVGPFRYVVVHNTTPAGNPLISWFDYGSSITLGDGESITVDFEEALRLFELT